MVGSNDIHLCTAELIEALTFYLTEKAFRPEYFKDCAITNVSRSNQGGADIWVVSLRPKTPPEAAR